jgi:nucleotide-binding universal stress UspA family protein
MGLKDLMVYVGTDPACAARLKVAVDLAAAHEAHLTGLHVMAWPTVPGYIDVQLPPEVHDRQRQRLLEEAARAEALFAERARQAGIGWEWRAVEGDVTETATLHARYFDLNVVGQGLDLDDPREALATLPEDLVLAVGRPLLVVPRYAKLDSVGDRILVCWNGSREATRAVNDALPFLRRASRVTVLSIDPLRGAGPRLPGADIALHLARHGVTTQAAQTMATDLEVGDVILSYAADAGADLIVMGAYGHSRLRETVFGGATRHLFQHMTVPVLMSH